MNENNLKITDNELDIVMVSLATTLECYNKYIKENGEDKLPTLDINTMKEIIKLHNKLEKEHY